METYRAAVIGCSRIGGLIDYEIIESGRLSKSRLPASHAAAYDAHDRVDLVACSDFREDVMEKFGERYNIPKNRQYTDYKEMVEKENLDIVSVATQPEPRAEITIWLANNGVKAIYAEKPMASSISEANSMVEACEANKVFFNLGTNRRWSKKYDAMKSVIDSGDLGKLKTLISYSFGSLFNTSSHWIDLLIHLNSDHKALWVQGNLTNSNGMIEGNHLTEDPSAEGVIKFENDVTAYCLQTNRGSEHEAILDNGTVAALSDGEEWFLRKNGPDDNTGRKGALIQSNFPKFDDSRSSALRIVDDLVDSLDTGSAVKGGVQVALKSTEIIFAFIESSLLGGAKVELPLKNNNYYLKRERAPRQPKYEAGN